MPELLGITRVASQSVLTRCLQGFTAAGDNLRCLRPLGPWGMAAGVLSHPAGKTPLKLAVPERERAWWRRLWEKI